MKQWAFYIFCLISLMLTMEVKYHGLPHSGYAQLVEWTFEQNNQKLNESFLARASIWDDFLGWFHLDIRNYATGFVFHAVLSLLALGCLISILWRDLEIKNPLLIILGIVALTFADDRILPCTYVSPVMALTGTPAAVAHALGFVVILFILRKKYYVAAIVFTMACAFNPRGTFVLGLVLAVCILYGSRRSWPALLIPMIWGIVQYVRMDTGEPLTLIDQIIQRDGLESSVPLIKIWPLLTFLLIFPLFAALNKDTPNRFHWIGIVVGFVSLGVLIGGWIYQAWLYPYWPMPAVWLLSPVRGMSYLVLFVHLSLICWISKNVPGIRRELILGTLALEYLIGVGYPWAWVVAGLAALVAYVPITPLVAAALCIGLLTIQLMRMEKGPQIYSVTVWDQAHDWTNPKLNNEKGK